jgi:hypothetical protein
VRASPTSRTRYVVVRYAHVREAVADRILEVIQIETAEQLADLLTKRLGREVFVRLREWVLGYCQVRAVRAHPGLHRGAPSHRAREVAMLCAPRSPPTCFGFPVLCCRVSCVFVLSCVCLSYMLLLLSLL